MPTRPFIFLFLFLSSTAIASNTVSIVPAPASVVQGSGEFILGRKTDVIYPAGNGEFRKEAGYLADRLRASTGFTINVRKSGKGTAKNAVTFVQVRPESLGAEAYRLNVHPGGVTIAASSSAGAFYAVQSLLQMFPPEVYASAPAVNVSWRIPAVSITDQPRFSWRGMHLDVCRHFFPKEFVKTYLDMLAMHKMNTFHWHLTDDQGWRIEIKKYPRLTSVGAWRVDRESEHWNSRTDPKPGETPSYGGFYSQDDIREILAYAAARHITVVPEIEMPAHAVAALAAYPQLSCSGGPFSVAPGGVWPDSSIFCAGNDSTFVFLQDVLTEVADLFPGTFIHIGGDEADKSQWKKCAKCQARIRKEGLKDEAELQSWFTKKMESFLASKHKRLIGWDEILEGGLPPEATVMSWRGTDGGIFAARNGHDVVMTPGSHCYFDHLQGPMQYEPVSIGGYTPLNKVYSYEPVPDSLTPDQAKHILGAQANLWTEYIPVPSHAQYMALPRMAALAEALWSPKQSRNWSNFVPRVEQQMLRYRAAGYNYARSAFLASISPSVDSAAGAVRIALSTEMDGTEIRYTLDGSAPSAASAKYEVPIAMNRSGVVSAASFKDGALIDTFTTRTVAMHAAFNKPVSVVNPYADRYNGGGARGLTNGLRGSLSFNDGFWQGYEQKDLDAVIDLGGAVSVSSLSAGFLQNTYAWIFYPSHVEYALSADGATWTNVATFDIPVATGPAESSTRELSKSLPAPVNARYVKVTAKNVGVCPEWHIGRGETCWLFIDEVLVN